MGLRGQAEAGFWKSRSLSTADQLWEALERAPKGEAALLEVAVPKILIKYLLGKVSGEWLEECSPLTWLSNGRADFGIEHNKVCNVIGQHGNDSRDATATTYPPGWLK